MTSNIEVTLKEGIIIVNCIGEMNEEIIRMAQNDIEKNLHESNAKRILYNTLEMSKPATNLALDMMDFDKKIKDQVEKSATVVPDSVTAYKATLAFVLSKNHKIFYNNLEKGMDWIKS